MHSDVSTVNEDDPAVQALLATLSVAPGARPLPVRPDGLRVVEDIRDILERARDQRHRGFLGCQEHGDIDHPTPQDFYQDAAEMEKMALEWACEFGRGMTPDDTPVIRRMAQVFFEHYSDSMSQTQLLP